MEVFVGFVGDLATHVGTVLVVTRVCSPPGSFDFSARPLGLDGHNRFFLIIVY